VRTGYCIYLKLLLTGRLLDSDIFYMDMAGTSVIVLNSYKAAKDLLDVRSTKYSSRYVFRDSVESAMRNANLPSDPGYLWFVK